MNSATPRPSRINSPSLGRPIQILLVEDSPSDREMTLEALRDGRILNEPHAVGDGEAAMRFLRHEGEYSNSPRPDLILLDLNLPKKDGREVLEELKADDTLKSIPVVILTTSSAASDILASYSLQASAYVTKPVGLDDFLAAVRGIENFWMELVRLPSA